MMIVYCPNCGKELVQNARFCDACDSPVASDQAAPATGSTSEQAAPVTPNIYADYPQTVSEPPKPRKKGLFLKITAIVLAAVVLLAGVTVLGYHTFLPAKMTLQYAQSNTLKKTWNYIEQSLDRSEKERDYLLNTPVKADTKINFKLDPGLLTALGLDEKMADLVGGYISNVTIQAISEADIPNKKQNFTLSLNYLNNPLISLNGFFDNDRMGVALPELSQKGIVGRLQDLSRLAELYPYSFDTSTLEPLAGINPWLAYDLRQELKIDRKDLKKLLDTYGMFLVNATSGGDMSIRRGKTTELFGEEIRCQEVTITLDQKAQLELVKSLLDTMAEDEALYNAVFGKVSKLLEILSAGNPALAENLPGMDMKMILGKSQIRTLLNTAKRSLSKDMFPEEAIIRIYIRGYDVVKYELEIPQTSTDEEILITFENVIDGDDLRMRLSFEGDSGYERVAMYLDIDQKYDKASDTSDLAVTFDVKLDDGDDGIFRIVYKSNEDPEGSNKIKRLIDASVDFELPYNDGISLTISADTTETRNKNGFPVIIEGTIDLSMGGQLSPSSERTNITLGLESYIQYDINVKTPDCVANAIDLGTATREDLEAYIEEIAETLGNIISMAQYLF